jgi:hypothetical protein
MIGLKVGNLTIRANNRGTYMDLPRECKHVAGVRKS